MAEQVDSTQTGYKKFERTDGSTFYQDSEGKFTNQQAFAGSKGREQYDVVLDEDGNITDNEPRDIDGPPPGAPWRSAIISEDYETEDRRGKTDLRIEAWTITREKHDMIVTQNSFDAAKTAVKHESGWRPNFAAQRTEEPRQISPEEATTFGRFAYAEIDGILYKVNIDNKTLNGTVDKQFGTPP